MRRGMVVFLLLFLLWAGVAAAQTPNSVITPQSITNGLFSFIQGTHAAGTLQTIFTPAGAGGARCNGMLITNNDPTATHVLNLVLENAGVPRTLATFTTVVNQGHVTGTPGIAPFTTAILPGLPVDSNNNPYLILKAGDTLRMQYATALTTGARINVYTSCVNF